MESTVLNILTGRTFRQTLADGKRKVLGDKGQKPLFKTELCYCLSCQPNLVLTQQHFESLVFF